MSRRWSSLAAVGLALAVPASAFGQKLFVEGAGGFALPGARLGSYTDAGAAAGLQVGYRLSNRIAVKVMGDFQNLNGQRVAASTRVTPDLRVIQYGAGVEAGVLQSRRNRVQLIADLGMGAASFTSDQYTWANDLTTKREFNHTYLATQTGLRLKVAPSNRMAFHIGGRAQVAFADEADTQSLANIDPARLRRFGSAVTLPITAGVTFRI